MKIGIDGSRAFLPQRTGIEEYSYQVIKNLMDKLNNHRVVLYIRQNQKIDFKLAENWRIKIIKWPIFWTQIGLSLEMLKHPVDALFIPAHTVPLIHPRKTIVTIHGLEYEAYPEGYSFWQRLYMRFSIRLSCRWAKKIITVSKNTRKDLAERYKVPEEKIEVVYEGCNNCHSGLDPESSEINSDGSLDSRFRGNDKYLLFIGRLEKRKNIEGIIEAYEILKEKYKIPHKLILAGAPGYGYGSIKYKIEISKYKKEIIETGYISNQEKINLLKNANVFLFPSFYEGFGLPIIEAQAAGVPVVTSNISSLPEIGGESVAYCSPKERESIVSSVYKIISDYDFREGIIQKGFENVKRFSWKKCAEEISRILAGS